MPVRIFVYFKHQVMIINETKIGFNEICAAKPPKNQAD